MLAMPDADSTFKSAREEAREIMEGMSFSAYGQARHKIGGGVSRNRDESEDQAKQRDIDRLLMKFDNDEQVRNKVCRVLGILTDEQRRLKLMHESTIAARDSADASARSAKSAAKIVWVSAIALGISLASFIISYFALKDTLTR